MSNRTKVLVTGASGFTGGHLLPLLQSQGYEVLATGASSTQSVSELDLTSINQVEKLVESFQPHKVIHLAAVSFVGHTDVREMYEVNVLGTRNLLGALASRVSHLDSVVVASSANVYGQNPKPFLSESEPLNPSNDYALTKVCTEEVARYWSHRIPMTIVRPFNYTGIGQSEKFVIPKIIRAFRDKEPRIKLGNTAVERDFSDVRDVVQVYLKLLEEVPSGKTYNIASGSPKSLGYVLDFLANQSNHKLEVESDPSLFREGEILSQCGDSSALRGDLGITSWMDFDTTLKWMLDTNS